MSLEKGDWIIRIRSMDYANTPPTAFVLRDTHITYQAGCGRYICGEPDARYRVATFSELEAASNNSYAKNQRKDTSDALAEAHRIAEGKPSSELPPLLYPAPSSIEDDDLARCERLADKAPSPNKEVKELREDMHRWHDPFYVAPSSDTIRTPPSHSEPAPLEDSITAILICRTKHKRRQLISANLPSPQIYNKL